MLFCGNITVSDLAGRAGLGPKPPKTPRKAHKHLPRRSAKKIAYMASQARVDGLAHMGRVAQMPCLVCAHHPVEVHHMPSPRSDMRVIPLCPQHHRREYGVGSYHYSARAFHAMHGPPEYLLGIVAARLNNKRPG